VVKGGAVKDLHESLLAYDEVTGDQTDGCGARNFRDSGNICLALNGEVFGEVVDEDLALETPADEGGVVYPKISLVAASVGERCCVEGGKECGVGKLDDGFIANGEDFVGRGQEQVSGEI
jgi:hypothetical protein